MAASPLSQYAKELLNAVSPREILIHACREVLSASHAVRVFGVLQQSPQWKDATLIVVENETREATAAERSALFALFRGLSRTRAPLVWSPDAETGPMHAALAPNAPTCVLQATPLMQRIGRVQGALVAVVDPGSVDASTASLTQDIAQLCSAGLENVRRLAIARRDQERLLLLSETADEAMWDWNLAKGEVWWGGGIEAVFGGGGVLVATGPTWRIDRIHADDVQRVTASLDAALAGEGSSWTGEYRFERADGEWIHVRDRAWLLREADGRCYRAIGVLRDVTALKRSFEREQAARAEAERASVTKDEFLAMLGHELRNPLAPIVAALSLSERNGALSSQQVQIVARQTQHLVRLVDDLLDISRITSGKIELSREPVRFLDVLQRALEQTGALVEQRRHQLHLDAEELKLDVDGARIGQVLANLVGNAAKYTEPGGSIHIRARRDGGRARIDVRDDGIGMAPELLEHVFESFVQGRQPLDRGQGGLGLGLSIVKNLVQLHGGEVHAHSEGTGKGSTLTVWLPIAQEAAQTSLPEPPRPSADRARRPVSVLLVDDNEDAVQLLGELLADSGHQVRIAYGGEAALALVEERAPDVAVLDIGLPGMSGYELAARLRDRLGDGVRLVALTGYGQESDRKRALDGGFDAHLVKPIDAAKLESAIRCG